MGLLEVFGLYALAKMEEDHVEKQWGKAEKRFYQWCDEHGYDVEVQKVLCENLDQRYPDIWVEMIETGWKKPRNPELYAEDPDSERRNPPVLDKRLRKEMEKFLCERVCLKYFDRDYWMSNPEFLNMISYNPKRRW